MIKLRKRASKSSVMKSKLKKYVSEAITEYATDTKRRNSHYDTEKSLEDITSIAYNEGAKDALRDLLKFLERL